MARKPIQYEYVVDVDVRGYSDDMAAFLDMLRYENSTVVKWSRTETGYRVTLRNIDRAPVVDRWRSFGIVPQNRDGMVLHPGLAGVDAII